jgi:glycosyltransferase involved in cell wall biosynthesis
MSDPVVSVIMPTYNAEKYLHEAVDSILSQTFSDFEFIVIDDGSTDTSGIMLSEYARKDARIRVYRQPSNQGIVAALNRGLALAQGKYIARMDADDISLPDRLKKQVAFMDTHPDIGVVGTCAEIINRDGQCIDTIDYPLTDPLIHWALCFYSPIIHPSIMACCGILRSAGGYLSTYPHTEDYELWARLSPTTHFANLPDRLLLLRMHDSNISVVNRTVQIKNSATISCNLIQNLVGYPCNTASVEKVLTLWRISRTEFESLTAIIIALRDHFIGRPGLTPNEKRYLVRQTTLRLVRLIRNAPTPGVGLRLLAHALQHDPLAVTDITRLTFRKARG